MDQTCVLCNSSPELRDHLFFESSYSPQTWEFLTKGILNRSYTSKWDNIVSYMSFAGEKGFCILYAMQCAIHALWRDSYKRRHGTQVQAFRKIAEKSIRNKLSLNIESGPKKHRGTLAFWFGSRE